MLSLDDLSDAIRAYESGEVSLDQFSAWFEDVSLVMFGESSEVQEVCLGIEVAFSKLRFEHIPELEFRKELADAIRPFVLLSPRLIPVSWSEGAEERPPEAVAAGISIKMFVKSVQARRPPTKAQSSARWISASARLA